MFVAVANRIERLQRELYGLEIKRRKVSICKLGKCFKLNGAGGLVGGRNQDKKLGLIGGGDSGRGRYKGRRSWVELIGLSRLGPRVWRNLCQVG